jgi:hypothetical protein
LLAIYVSKKWIANIRGAADFLQLETEVSDEYDILMASEKKIDTSYPFVAIEALRHPSTLAPGIEPVIRVRIPTAEILAIFDFTKADSKKMGFVSGEHDSSVK